MLRRTNAVWVMLAVGLLAVTWSVMGLALPQKAATPKPQDKLVLGEPEVRQLLLLMDTDKSGKISKQEWIQFMEAEFDRLDTSHKGQLDVKELAQSRVWVRPFVGK